MLYNIIIIQEIKRYRLYCSNDIDFFKILNLYYKQRLYDRGYKPSIIDKYFEKDRIPTRESLINNLIQPTRSAKSENAKTPIVVVQLPALGQPINLKDTFAIPPELYNHTRFKLAYNNINLIIGKKTIDPP